jgi:hypothetical protein
MTYLENFLRMNPDIFEPSRLIWERCPGHYFEGGPKQPEPYYCQQPDTIGCRQCWNLEIPEGTGNYITGRKCRFPYDSKEVYPDGP